MDEAIDIRLDNVRKRFGGTPVVDGVSLSVRRGEMVSLLGPSGCGKTTTLRIIAGLEELDEGRVWICGECVNDVAPYRRNLGVVFQNYALFPHMTVYDNIAFGLRMRGMRRAAIDDRVASVTELVRLPGLEARFPSQLSGGQRQRVALARALAPRPAVLLLDEPLAALDKKLREQVQLELKQLQSTLGITTIFVTHDQAEALTLSDRVAVMNEGQIVQLGAPEDLYDGPASRFVADFLGETNFLTGTVESIDDGSCTLSLTGGISVAATARDRFAIGEAVKLAIRPERVALAPGDGAGTGTVRQVVYGGATVAVHVELAGGGTVMARVPSHGTGPRWQVGDRVDVSWDPAVAKLYRDTGTSTA
ncbi:MAG: ABC transporter ATP-binding protein [Thermomicrobiales bacterium]|nr:ABC transporter ATP-binding protein [Thermomicrobiales bacterium]